MRLHFLPLFPAIAFSCTAMSADEPASTTPTRPLLVANYYTWYRDASHPTDPLAGWTRPGRQKPWPQGTPKPGPPDEPATASTAYPLAGLYDSRDSRVAEWHVKLAQAAGIDAFLVDWWGTHKGRDKAAENGILAAAERCQFKIALLDERSQFHNDFEWYKTSLTGALARFKDSPAYLKIDGKPAVYLYQVANDPALTPQKFLDLKLTVEKTHGPVYWIVDKIAHDHKAARAGDQARIKHIPADWLATPGIDCFAFYSTFSNFRAGSYDEIAGKYRHLAKLAHDAGKKMLLPVHPGHDNSRFGDTPYIMPRRDGQTLKDYLRAASDAGADIVMVTSWNEWPETTIIEPSSTWPDPYLYLRILATWKGRSFSPPPRREAAPDEGAGSDQ